MIPKPWQEFISQSREERTKRRLVRKLRNLRHLGSTRVQIGSRTLSNFSSNDYLGLAGDLRIAEAAAAAAGRFGWGTGASRLVTGTNVLHHKLEQEVARFRGTEAALVYGSGYQANLGVITGLAGKGDVILSDEMNHASIVAGCRLSGAHVRVFKHRDYDDLARQLGTGGKGRRLVVTDTLFSIEGDVCDLPRIVKICERSGALLVIDDAHASGALGRKGKGIPELQNVLPHMSVIVGTFSKALGSYGGFVACSNDIREHLINESRPFIYTTAMPVAVAAANLEALRIVQKEGEGLRNKLAGHVRTLRSRLQNLEVELTGAHHIIGMRVGDPDKAQFLADEVEAQGMLAYPMRWPSIPEGKEMLRISVSAAHTDEEIGRLVHALRAAIEHMGGKRTSAVSRREAKRPSARALEVAADGDLDESAFAEEDSGMGRQAQPHGAPAPAMGEMADAPELDRYSSGRMPTVDSSDSGGFEALLNEELAYESPDPVRVTLLEEAADEGGNGAPTAAADSGSDSEGNESEGNEEEAPDETDHGGEGGDDVTGRRLAVAPAEPMPAIQADPAQDGWPEDDSGSEALAAAGELAGRGDPVIADLASNARPTRRQNKTRRTTKRTTKPLKRPAD